MRLWEPWTAAWQSGGRNSETCDALDRALRVERADVPKSEGIVKVVFYGRWKIGRGSKGSIGPTSGRDRDGMCSPNGR